MKLNKVLLNVSAVVCFIFGAFYIFSLVFIPIGIYCFVAGRRFSYKADHMMDNYAIDQKTMRNYAIFASIVCFPLGLLSLIAYFRIYGNNVKVETAKVIKTELNEEQRLHEDADFIPEEIQEESKVETEEEKIEKLEKLRKFKEKGIITEDEFEMARQQMFGDEKWYRVMFL